MHIDELCDRFGLARQTIWNLVSMGLVAPARRRGPGATYPPQTVEDLKAYTALRHISTSMTDVVALLKEDGISLADYAQRREDAIQISWVGRRLMVDIAPMPDNARRWQVIIVDPDGTQHPSHFTFHPDIDPLKDFADLKMAFSMNLQGVFTRWLPLDQANRLMRRVQGRET